MRDVKTNDLFTINEVEYDEFDKKSETYYKYKRHEKITFPTATGITGKVFGAGKMIYSNNAHKETSFSNDVDNLTDCNDVRNYIIAPVYGYQEVIQDNCSKFNR